MGPALVAEPRKGCPLGSECTASALVAGAKRVRRPRTREVIARAECPNFRDHRMTVEAALLRVLASLQRRYGEAWASEAGLRQMIAEDTGHMPGVDTIPCALERLERRGILKQVWLEPSNKRTGRAADVLPNGQRVVFGTRLIFLAKSRGQRRAFRAHARRRAQDNKRAFLSLVQARTTVANAVASAAPMSADAWEARRQAQLEAARAFVAQGLDAPPSTKPPD